MSRDLGSMLGDLLASRAEADSAALLRATVALLHRERGMGHVCLELDAHAGSARDEQTKFPAAPAWAEELRRSGLVATAEDGDQPAAAQPLVLNGGRLYLHRDHAAEQRILSGLRRRLAAEPAIEPARVHAALGECQLLPPAGDEPDWQLAAIAAGASSRFLLLTGGPGTGKTTTVARLLSVLLALEPATRIALCAPTGKAAARMAEAIGRHADTDARLRAALPLLQPQTLHRLLGYWPLDDTFRRGRERPLEHDIVVVDEASMLDPALLAVLLEALPERSRLVLVGDRDQLAAVAAGQILGDLSRAAAPERGTGAPLAEFLHQATGMRVPVQPQAAPIANAVIALCTNHRFGAQPGLDHFAQALARRDADAALAVLDAGYADLQWAASPDEALELVAADLLACTTLTPADAVARLGQLRILAASRHGALGTVAWNRRVERLLAQHDVRTDDPWYRGRPVLVTANDHYNRIYNGDLGVAGRDENGVPGVAFAAADGQLRTVSAFRVPAHETAWAMTVHKSQGSEFDTVLLSMPEVDGPLWQAPLLYTGITRARKRAILIADRDRMAAGLGRWPERSSGLLQGLLEGLPQP